MNKVFNKTITIFILVACTNSYAHQLNLDAITSLKPATFAQEIMFNHAKKQANLESAMFKLINNNAAKIRSYKGTKINTLFMINSPNLDDRLFALYHELGHKANISLESVDQYLVLGQAAIDNSSNIGSLIKRALTVATENNSPHQFWIPPTDQEALALYSLTRKNEQHADLYALHQLYAHGFMQTLLRWIEYLVSCNQHTRYCTLDELYIVSKNLPSGKQDKHPSNIERAIYIVGFLASHGININAALLQYEAHGTCIDGENIPTMLGYLKAQPNNYLW